jgi:hypothetical protein
MTAPASLIEQQMAVLIEADTALASLKRLYLGVPYKVPTQDYPYAVVVVDNEETEKEYTGNHVVRAYSGAVIINVLHQDIPKTVTGKIARVPSYETMRDLVDAVVKLFKTTANRNLTGFTFENGLVQQIIMGDELIEYGITAQQERTDNFTNYGIIPFVVKTMEVMP